MTRTKHYHAMNGTSGCMPDNNEVHTSKREAIRSLVSLFDSQYGLFTRLTKTGIFYFAEPSSAGADYAQVCECHDADCLNGEDF